MFFSGSGVHFLPLVDKKVSTMVEGVSKYKESIVFASCATALLGTVLLLQKATTPSQHRRHAGSSASHGVPRLRSVSRGPAGERSRASSKARGSHRKGDDNATPAAPANPVTSVTTGDCNYASRSRGASQVPPHRHHSHPRGTNGSNNNNDNNSSGAAATVTKPAANTTEPQVKAGPLTVEAVAQHTKSLGMANTLHNLGHGIPLIGSPAEPHRDVRTSGGGRSGGGGGGVDDGTNYRSASNAATVGSQALNGASTTSPTTRSGVHDVARLAGGPLSKSTTTAEDVSGLPPRSPRVEAPAAVAVVSANSVALVTASATTIPTRGAPATAVQACTSETQTCVRWFCNDHGTQTEPHEETRKPLLSSVTPVRRVDGVMMSPIMPSGEGSDSTLLNCDDFGWTPMREVDCTKSMDAAAPGGAKQLDGSLIEVPKYFLSKLEAQIRFLLQQITEDAANEIAWMRLYMYLSELPLTVREALVRRDRCGVTSGFISLAISMAQDMPPHSSVTSDGAATATMKSVSSRAVATDAAAATTTTTSASLVSLPQEVLHLLQHATPQTAAVHFEWRNHRCVCVEGEGVPRVVALPPLNSNSEGEGRARLPRFAHVQLSPSSSEPSSCAASDEGHQSDKDEEEEGATSIVVAVAKHIQKYQLLLLPAAVKATGPHTDLEEHCTSQKAAEMEELPRGDHTPTRNTREDVFGEVACVHQLQIQQQQLASYLAAFLQLRQTDVFQAMRHSPQFAPLACDFIELSASVQHYLDLTSLSPDSPTAAVQMLQVPTTLTRLAPSEVTDIRDTSIGTSTSVRSDSIPVPGGLSRLRRGGKPRTPMKPSIRYPIQHQLSSSPSLAGVSAGSDGH
jgi:hypothetical protein